MKNKRAKKDDNARRGGKQIGHWS